MWNAQSINRVRPSLQHFFVHQLYTSRGYVICSTFTLLAVSQVLREIFSQNYKLFINGTFCTENYAHGDRMKSCINAHTPRGHNSLQSLLC